MKFEASSEIFKSWLCIPRSAEQTQSPLQCEVLVGARRTLQSSWAWQDKGIFFNVDSCVSNTQLPLLWVIIRRSISSVYTDSFATHTFSDASCFEMGYLMPPILTVGLGRVTLKLTVTHLNATVGILLGVANVEKSRALSMLSCVLNTSDKTKAGKLS